MMMSPRPAPAERPPRAIVRKSMNGDCARGEGLRKATLISPQA